MKKVLSSVLVAFFVLLVTGIGFAAVQVQENGTTINKSEKVNFKYGPNVTGNGTATDVDFSTMTGSQTITGDVSVTGTVAVTGSETISNDLTVTDDLTVTGSDSGINFTDAEILAASATVNWQDASFLGTNINWTDIQIVGTDINWQDSTIQTEDINWSSVTSSELQAATSVNWALVTGL